MVTVNDPAVGVPYGYPQPPTGFPPSNGAAGPGAQSYPQNVGDYPPQKPQDFGGHFPQNTWGKAPQSPEYAHGVGVQPPSSSGHDPRSPYHVTHPTMVSNAYHQGYIPPNAVYAHRDGVHLQDTFYGDTPAPFQCQICGKPGLTTVRSERSVASYVACMMSACIGVCFLLPSCDCLWHKYHYCPSCGQKVGDFCKTDPCLVMDPTQWTRPSFGVPWSPAQP